MALYKCALIFLFDLKCVTLFIQPVSNVGKYQWLKRLTAVWCKCKLIICSKLQRFTVKYLVAMMIDLGRRQIVKCLVDVRRVFVETGDQRYILNDLYIDDYCAWTQHIRSSVNLVLSTVQLKCCLFVTHFSRSSLSWPLFTQSGLTIVYARSPRLL